MRLFQIFFLKKKTNFNYVPVHPLGHVILVRSKPTYIDAAPRLINLNWYEYQGLDRVNLLQTLDRAIKYICTYANLTFPAQIIGTACIASPWTTTIICQSWNDHNIKASQAASSFMEFVPGLMKNVWTYGNGTGCLSILKKGISRSALCLAIRW